ncbi:MAG: PAS domain-containing protein [Gammaproteobacteria bacterium]|nr:PAS domain-containing protein [Gammaproteobacteria bacterium]
MIDFKDVVDRIPDMVFAADPENYNILYVNTGIRNILGYRQEECLEQPRLWWDSIHIDDKEKISQEISVVIQTGEEKDLSYRIHLKNGDISWVRNNIVVKTDPANQGRYILGVIHVENRDEESLENLQQNLSELLEDSSSVIYRCEPDENHSIIYITDNITRLLGFSPEELINKKNYWFDNLHPDDRADVANSLSGLVDKEHCVNEYRFRDCDGEYRLLRDELQIVRDKNGMPESIVGCLVDLTSSKYYKNNRYEKEKSIHHASRMRSLSALIGGIAHEFNNMLGVVIGYGGLLLKTPDLNEVNKKYINHILSASDRSKSLVQQLLIFSRKNIKKIEQLDVCDKITEEINHIRTIIPEDIDLKIENNCNNQSILIDQQEFRQILQNVVNNAVYAVQDKGVIKIAVNNVRIREGEISESVDLSEGDYIKVSVTDNGAGIGKGEYHRVFEPFYTTKAIGQGTGMGLAVVYSMLKSYGGGVNVHSKKNIYTTFELYFPIADQSMLSILQPTDFYPVPEYDGLKILYVDNEELYLDAVCDMLTQLGHQVTAYSSAKEAFKNFEINPYAYDVVIADHVMPAIMGDQFSRAILRLRQDIDIIICTGDDVMFDKKYLRDNGINSVLIKPFTISELEDKITNTKLRQNNFH